MKTLGIIGYPLTHSFSPKYFYQKFEKLKITDIEYKLFELKDISKLELMIENEENLIGFSVTIPYKKAIIPFLDEIDIEAKEIGAVNTVAVKDRKLKGYNTDFYGFQYTLDELAEKPKSAIIFGNGGASEAVKYALKKKGIDFIVVSRKSELYNYENLTADLIQSHPLLINTTPVGMYPNNNEKLPIPHDGITPQHALIDLIYNPVVTSFMQMGIEKGAFAINGQQMLEKQADRAWEMFEI